MHIPASRIDGERIFSRKTRTARDRYGSDRSDCRRTPDDQGESRHIRHSRGRVCDTISVAFDGFLTGGQNAAFAAALILPMTLMKSHLDYLWTRVFCFEVTASIATLLPGLIYTTRSNSLRQRDCWTAILSFVATVVVSGWLARKWSFVLWDVQFPGSGQLPGKRSLAFLVCPSRDVTALGSLGDWRDCCRLMVRSRPSNEIPGRLIYCSARFKLIFGSLVLLLAAVRTTNPGYTVTVLTLMPGFVTPFCWLLLYPPSPEAESASFPRILLSATAIFQTLVAHPIGGSQAFFTRILLILVGALLIGDFSPPLRHLLRGSRLTSRPAMYAAALTVLLMFPFKYVMLANQDRQTYESRPSLALTGAKKSTFLRRRRGPINGSFGTYARTVTYSWVCRDF